MAEVRVAVATASDMAAISRLRHDAYARELGQHPVRDDGRLPDALDGRSTYLVVTSPVAPPGSGAPDEGTRRVDGFVSVTPPWAGRYSLDKDVARDELPFPVDGAMHEVRLLTVRPDRRGGLLAALLMLAALRWVQAAGGTRLLVKGRRDLVGMYERVGLVRSGVVVRSGAVDYEVMSGTTDAVEDRASALTGVLSRRVHVHWDPSLGTAPVGTAAVAGGATETGTTGGARRSVGGEPVGCFHGGASWDAIGADFADLGRRKEVVPADVLDAWFPAAPGVLQALADDPSWWLRTSPPTDCVGVVEAVAAARGLDPITLVPGAGSSALVFLALGRWLSRSSRVLLLDPTYGEYAHVLQRLVGARVDSLPLRRDDGWALDPQRIVAATRDAERSGRPYDLVVLVNPNSPTGRHVPREALEAALEAVPTSTRVWVDETYVDYVEPLGADQSVERFAAASPNVVVVKSMSKAYALSGARVAYLCGPAHLVSELRDWTPPWAVSLPAQVAAVRALADPAHYTRCWAQTAVLRADLAAALTARGLEVVPGTANFLLAALSDDGPTAAVVVERCRRAQVHLRDAGGTGHHVGERAVRVSVRSAADNARVLRAIDDALRG